MRPFHQILVGDCIDILLTLLEQSVQCCVTSSHDFWLRNYGINGQIGVEQTPADFIDRLFEVFSEDFAIAKWPG